MITVELVYCIPRIVEVYSACSSRKGGIIVAVMYVAVESSKAARVGCIPMYIRTYTLHT